MAANSEHGGRERNNHASTAQDRFPATGAHSQACIVPEPIWFFAWFRSAGQYVSAVTVYLGLVLAFVLAWKALVAEQADRVDLTIYAIAGIVALPLLFALLFNLLPTLRRRRERAFRPIFDSTKKAEPAYFQTGPRVDDPYGFFAAGYERFLDWTRQPKAPVLHLTGLSGSGKSSLIEAYLKPRLEEQSPQGKTVLVSVCDHGDPLASMKDDLLRFWKRKPDDYDSLSTLQALQRAARQLDTADRLLVVFDQFEEFFLLRMNALARQANVRESDATSGGDPQSIESLKDFLQSFLAEPPDRVTLLFAYREDHRRLLSVLSLPPRQESINWMPLDPFDFATAETFLRSCPGLSVPKPRMDCVLREAARQEGGRVVMRPILANVLGVILYRMAAHPTMWHRKSDLLTGYVRECLGVETQRERIQILRVLLTHFHTARPRTVAQIASEARLPLSLVDSQMDLLGHAGLVRCLNVAERDQLKRTWQIAHDFLALLIQRVLDGIYRSTWRKIRSYIAPVTFVIVLTGFGIWPWVQEHRDVSLLANQGFTWNEPTAAVVAGTKEAHAVQNLEHISGALHRLGPRRIDLSDCKSLVDVATLNGLSSLEDLQLTNCERLQELRLHNLPSVNSLRLNGCGSLQNVDSLRRLSSLDRLDLSGCSALRNVDGLTGLKSLRFLLLIGCQRLRDIDGLQGLESLDALVLASCPALENVNGAHGLTSLRKLLIADCGSLRELGVLHSLTSLQELSLLSCDSLHDLAGLKYLTSLYTLTLACRSLHNIDELQGLTSLTNLDIQRCDALKSLSVLRSSKSLEKLVLSSCNALEKLDGVQGLTSLRTLTLNSCDSLEDLDGLQFLTSLRNLDLSDCRALKDVATLRNLKWLDKLILKGCPMPEDSWRALVATLANTTIVSPDGSAATP